MYCFIDGFCFLAGLALFIFSFTFEPLYALLAVGWVTLYPLILETIYNIAGSLSPLTIYQLEPRTRFVYHPRYNITFCGLEKLHSFDSSKYERIYELLVARHVVKEGHQILPNTVPRSLLLQRMSKWYLLKMCYTLGVCQYIELPLIFLPAFLLRWRVLSPMLFATEGTILSALAAVKLGWAVNLSGGYHHANYASGGGFCVYPDISLAIHYLQTRLDFQRIMIIDLDAHQGNGHERDYLKCQGVFIVDCYNHHIYPGDSRAKPAIRLDLSVDHLTTDDDYFMTMQAIWQQMDDFKPEFVIYNAGTDILEGDSLGRCSITRKGILRRDELVIGECVKRGIPVTMLLSGGYQYINAQVIADSIENLFEKWGDMDMRD